MDGESRPLCINRAGEQNFTHPEDNLTQFISLDCHRHDRGRMG